MMDGSTCWWGTTAVRRCCCEQSGRAISAGRETARTKCNRDAVARGSMVCGGVTRTRLKNSGGSYLHRTIRVKCWGWEQRRKSIGWRSNGRSQRAHRAIHGPAGGPLPYGDGREGSANDEAA